MHFLNTKLKRSLIILFTVVIAIFFYFKKSDNYYVVSCEVFDLEMELVHHFPGTNCEYFNDGSVLVAMGSKLTYFNKRMQILWQKNIIVHHSLESSFDQRKILLLANEFKSYNGVLTRFDVIKILDLKTGDELASWSSFDHSDKILKMVTWKYIKEEHPAYWEKNKDEAPANFEFFHFNSFYEIPKNPKEKELPFIHENNYVVNTGLGPVLFFDKNLNLLSSVLLNPSPHVNLHDVQVTPEGHLLIYRNWTQESKSRLELLELPQLKTLWSFSGNRKFSNFFSKSLGSVQQLENGNFFFSDITEGGRILEIKPNGDLLNDIEYPEIDLQTNQPRQILKAKIRNLAGFISNHNNQLE